MRRPDCSEPTALARRRVTSANEAEKNAGRIDLGVAALKRNAGDHGGFWDCGLIEVLDVPASLREVVPEGLAALSFLSNEAVRARERAAASAYDTRSIDIGVPGYELFFCTVGRVPIEFMGGYSDNNDSSLNDAASS